MEWIILERPGYTGKKKSEKHAKWNAEYGENNWRLMWAWNGQIITPEFTYQLYEDGYYTDSFRREKLWVELIKKAKDIYDLEPRDIESGLDYLVQKGIATHLQDIAIRRVVSRRGWNFEGNELIQIRSADKYWSQLNPGNVPFHLPELIVEPHLTGWWKDNSVEDFYQSNKILQIKKS